MDKFWKSDVRISRETVYRWMTQQLNYEVLHIGEMNEEQLLRALAIVGKATPADFISVPPQQHYQHRQRTHSSGYGRRLMKFTKAPKRKATNYDDFE